MKVNGYNITDFVVTTYADMFQRKAVIAYTSDGQCGSVCDEDKLDL